MHTLKYQNISSALCQVQHSTDILFSIFQQDNYFNILNLLSSESVFYSHRENDAFTNDLKI